MLDNDRYRIDVRYQIDVKYQMNVKSLKISCESYKKLSLKMLWKNLKNFKIGY